MSYLMTHRHRVTFGEAGGKQVGGCSFEHTIWAHCAIHSGELLLWVVVLDYHGTPRPLGIVFQQEHHCLWCVYCESIGHLTPYITELPLTDTKEGDNVNISFLPGSFFSLDSFCFRFARRALHLLSLVTEKDDHHLATVLATVHSNDLKGNRNEKEEEHVAMGRRGDAASYTSQSFRRRPWEQKWCKVEEEREPTNHQPKRNKGMRKRHYKSNHAQTIYQ